MYKGSRLYQRQFEIHLIFLLVAHLSFLLLSTACLIFIIGYVSVSSSVASCLLGAQQNGAQRLDVESPVRR